MRFNALFSLLTISSIVQSQTFLDNITEDIEERIVQCLQVHVSYRDAFETDEGRQNYLLEQGYVRVLLRDLPRDWDRVHIVYMFQNAMGIDPGYLQMLQGGQAQVWIRNEQLGHALAFNRFIAPDHRTGFVIHEQPTAPIIIQPINLITLQVRTPTNWTQADLEAFLQNQVMVRPLRIQNRLVTIDETDLYRFLTWNTRQGDNQQRIYFCLDRTKCLSCRTNLCQTIAYRKRVQTSTRLGKTQSTSSRNSGRKH